MGTKALCSSKMPCDILAFTRRVGLYYPGFRCPYMTWMATHSPFSAGPVCCKVLAMSGANSHSSFVIFRDIKFTCSVENQLGLGDLWSLWTRRATLASQNQDWRDAIQYLVYRIARRIHRPERALQIHGGTQRITEERFVVLSIVCYVTNISEVR